VGGVAIRESTLFHAIEAVEPGRTLFWRIAPATFAVVEQNQLLKCWFVPTKFGSARFESLRRMYCALLATGRWRGLFALATNGLSHKTIPSLTQPQ
jgi:hypothetical protein